MISQKELENGLELIRVSYNCPSCGLPTGDLSDMNKYFCDPKRGGCGETFEIEGLNRVKNKLTIYKIKELSKYQISNTLKSSIMDKPYNPELFIERKEFTDKIKYFLKSHTSNLFLLLGEAGFGKTWALANIAEKLLEEYIVFYIPLRKNYKLVFSLIFGTENISDIQLNISREILNIKSKIIWIFDGYDEMRDQELKSSFLAMCTQWLSNTTQQKIILSSRSYDWDISDNSTNDWKKQLTNMFLWSEGDSTESYRLEKFTDKEIQMALRRYKLPEFSAFDSSLQHLLRYPLWIRIIKEWQDIHNMLPNSLNRELIIHYFERMRVEESEIRVLAELSYNLVLHGDLNGKIAVTKIRSMDKNTLNNLNSAGILQYYKKMFKSEIKIFDTIFAVIGIGYYITLNQNNYNVLKQLNKKLKILKPIEIKILMNFLEYMDIEEYGLSIIKKGIYKNNKLLDEFNSPIYHNNKKISGSKENKEYNNVINVIDKISKIYKNNISLVRIVKRLDKPIDQVRFILEDMILNGYINASINTNNTDELEDDILELKDKWNIPLEKKLLEVKIDKVHNLIEEDKNYTKAWDMINEILDNPYLTEIEMIMDYRKKIQPHIYNELEQNYREELEHNRYSNAIMYIDKILQLELSVKDRTFWDKKREEVKEYTETKDYLGVKLLTSDYLALKHIEELINKKVELSVNKVDSETFGFAYKNNRVTELGLYNLEMTSLPESIGKLTKLQKLVLNKNQLKSLPKSTGNLTNLQQMELLDNQLISLPESIIKLEKLTHLKIEVGMLKSRTKKIDEWLSSKLLYFNNVELLGKDCLTLMKLEELINTEIPVVNNIYRETFGYVHKNNRVIALGLYNLGMTSLPDNIDNLTGMQKLYLYNNKLSSLPESIINLEELKYLNLSRNNLKSLSKEVENWLSSKILYYYNVELLGKDCLILMELERIINLEIPVVVNIYNDTFGYVHKNKRVIALGLYNQKLSYIPEIIDYLDGIEKLYLNNNNLSSLPNSICNLPNIKVLNLKSNTLTNLPKCIGELKNLKMLNLRSNRLTVIPDSIGNLVNLEFIDMDWDKVKLPETVINWSKITKLDLSKRGYTSLHNSLGNLTNLIKLNISNNKLTSLPETIGNLSNLQKFIISYNQLTSLPESFGNINNLQVLIIDNNNLISLPESIINLNKLTYIDLSGNKMSELTQSVGNWLSSQVMHYYNVELLGKDCLTLLFLEGIINKKIPAVDKLTDYSFGYIHKNKRIVELSLYNQKLDFLPNIIGNLTKINILNLRSNNLDSLPHSIGKLTNLIKLNLFKNKLTTLPDSIGNLVNLQILDLRWNKLNTFLENIGLNNLQNLGLNPTKSKFFQNNIGNLFNLKKQSVDKKQSNTLSERTVEALLKLKQNGCTIYGLSV